MSVLGSNVFSHSLVPERTSAIADGILPQRAIPPEHSIMQQSKEYPVNRWRRLMKQVAFVATIVACAALVQPGLVAAQTAPSIPPSITTPDKVETRLGTLD